MRIRLSRQQRSRPRPRHLSNECLKWRSSRCSTLQASTGNAQNTKRTLSDVNAKALVDAIANILKAVETETLIDIVAEMEAEAVVDALPDTLADLKTAKLMADAKAKALFDALAIMLKTLTPTG